MKANSHFPARLWPAILFDESRTGRCPNLVSKPR